MEYRLHIATVKLLFPNLNISRYQTRMQKKIFMEFLTRNRYNLYVFSLVVANELPYMVWAAEYVLELKVHDA